MQFLILIGCCMMAIVLLNADKPKHHDHFVIYRNRCVRIGQVPPLEMAQLN